MRQLIFNQHHFLSVCKFVLLALIMLAEKSNCQHISSKVGRYEPGSFVSNHLLVKFKPQQTGSSNFDSLFKSGELLKLSRKHKCIRRSAIGTDPEGARTFLLEFDNQLDIEKAIDQYSRTGLFKYVEPDFIRTAHSIPNDPHWINQWSHHNKGNNGGKTDADIDMDKAWEIETGSSSIVVAVLDAGINADHPEFKDRLTSTSWDFVDDDNNPNDEDGHGTRVAGVIAANANNGIGFAGVDWHCKLMICRIADAKETKSSLAAKGIRHAVKNGARVINMSFGGPHFSQTALDAVNYAHKNNVVMVATGGNNGKLGTRYPAGYPNVIGVGYTTNSDSRAHKSSYGKHIDLVAPGVNVPLLDYKDFSNYSITKSGSSYAAPLVTGVASLLLAQDPNRTPNQIRSILQKTAEDQVGKPSEDKPGYDQYHGYGRLNAYRALSSSSNSGNLPLLDNTKEGCWNGSVNAISVYDPEQKCNMTCPGTTNYKRFSDGWYIIYGNWSSGIYNLKIQDNAGNGTTKKVHFRSYNNQWIPVPDSKYYDYGIRIQFCIVDNSTSSSNSGNLPLLDNTKEGCWKGCINVFPNPTNAELNISLSGIKIGPAEIRDLTGKKIRQIELHEGLNKLNISDIAEGMYTINALIDGKHVLKRFIKTE